MMPGTPNTIVHENSNLLSGLQASINTAHCKGNWPATTQENGRDRIMYGAISNSMSAWTREHVKPLQMTIKTRLTKTLHISLKLLGKMHIHETTCRHCFHSSLIVNSVCFTQKQLTTLFQMWEMLTWQINLLKLKIFIFLRMHQDQVGMPR